ncbi:hypothetical protein K3495_g13461 [Podosphaera aphanis]|nr:hypothetical protein K3495_g13461 [Podosphaera aphanis]
MSLFGLSKADREIIAQNPGLNRTGNNGDQLWKENVGRPGHIPGNYGEDSDSGPNKHQTENTKSRLKGKGIDRNPERKIMDEPESSERNLEQSGWKGKGIDRNTERKTYEEPECLKRILSKQHHQSERREEMTLITHRMKMMIQESDGTGPL